MFSVGSKPGSEKIQHERQEHRLGLVSSFCKRYLEAGLKGLLRGHAFHNRVEVRFQLRLARHFLSEHEVMDKDPRLRIKERGPANGRFGEERTGS
jgi:hypothetical protein